MLFSVVGIEYLSIFFIVLNSIYLNLKCFVVLKRTSINNPCVKYEKAVERIKAEDVSLNINRNIKLVEM